MHASKTPKNLFKVFITTSFTLCFLCFQGQIVDDSTVTNLSFSQTQYFLKKDVVRGDTTFRKITQDRRFDRFQHNFDDQNLMQILGIYASAGRSYLSDFPMELGNHDGLDSYNYLAFQDPEVRYYDTKTPYSSLTYQQGLGTQGLLEGEYAQSYQNIATIGAKVRRITSNDNLGTNPNNLSYSENIALQFNGAYRSKNNRYRALLNYRYMKHDVLEHGGALLDSTTLLDLDGLILADFVPTNLEEVSVIDKRNEWSVYQEFKPFGRDKVKIFHELNRIKKVNSYIDQNLQANQAYYPALLLDSAATQDSNVFRMIENKVGLNGRLADFSYTVFLKNRLWKYQADTNLTDTASLTLRRQSDTYVGGSLTYHHDQFEGDLYLEQGIDGTRKIAANTDLKYLKVSFLNLLNRPSLRSLSWSDNHFSWQNDFENTEITRLKLEPYLDLKQVKLGVFALFQSYQNYVYYGDDFRPVQQTDRRSIALYGAHGQFNWRQFKFYQFGQFAQLNNADFVRMPTIYTHSNVDYTHQFKTLKTLDLNVGLDLFYFNGHSPMLYRADVQRFSTQQGFQDQGYLKLDAYLNARYKTVSAYIKAVNILQGLNRNSGYYPTVGYFGRQRAIEIGLKWVFFG